MKLRSIIWTLLFFSFLQFSGAKSGYDTSIKSPTKEEVMDKEVEDLYKELSDTQRVELLTVYSVSQSTTQNSDSITPNAVLFNPNLKSYNVSTAVRFQDEILRITSATLKDSLSISRHTIGQTGIEKLAYYAQCIDLEKYKSKGANVVLGDFFQTYLSNWENTDKSYQESPLSSEKYWQKVLLAGEENGIKIGVNDFFFSKYPFEETRTSEFSALGLAGNRYYARKGHGIVQLSSDIEQYKLRLPQYKDSTRQTFLRNEVEFEGIILSEDFSELPKKVQIESALQSLMDGSDMICISESQLREIQPSLVEYYKSNPEKLKISCLKILKLKHQLFSNREKNTAYKSFATQFEFQAKQAALSCVKNQDNILPIKNLRDTISFFTSNENEGFFKNEVGHYAPFYRLKENQKNRNQICLLDGFGTRINQALAFASQLKGTKKLILLTDAKSFYTKRTFNYSNFDGIILTTENSDLDKSLAIQVAFGAFGTHGKLPYYHSTSFQQSSGIQIFESNRLKYIDAQYLGIDSLILNGIDRIAQSGVNAQAFPGCQVLFAVEGVVVYNKPFGYQDYTKTTLVSPETIYDIASISKIAASTVSLMKLQSENKFSLKDSLKNYIPEVVGDNPMGNIWLKDMMAHQAGLPAWIPFYLKTLDHGKLDPVYYSNEKQGQYTVPVAKDVWLRKDYPDTIYKRILSNELKGKSYVYSDIGYYFVKKIIEKLSRQRLEEYVENEIYSKLGLQTMTFNPYLKFNLDRIAPTENDKTFRKQTIHGYVHDPGSAMMGGVCGHAGIFSTANDLAILMQMMLNQGYYGGVSIIKPEVLQEYTSVQFPGKNKRGAGFDKPNLSGSAATACADASPGSFGHSGFTGTLTWADPLQKINYVFLSNRVNPSVENWKIVHLNIRTDIQIKIYQAVRQAKNYNFLVRN